MNFFGLLTIVFITLKLLGVIEWNWVWVIAPVWIPFILFLIVLLVAHFLESAEKNGRQ